MQQPTIITFAAVKFFAFIMICMLFAQSIMPCADVSCNTDTVKTAINLATHDAGNTDEDNCPPLCSCACAHNYIDNKFIPVKAPVTFSTSAVYNSYYLSSVSEYHPSLFQPPRLG